MPGPRPAERDGQIILAFDTAGAACSVAVARGADLLATERRDMQHGHGEALMPMIDATMRAAGIVPTKLDAVAVSLGPGGFTGIRVGLAAAHGIALASGARLVGTASFAAVAAALSPAEIAGRTILAALDSRRADLYVQLLDADGEPLVEPRTVMPDRLGKWVADAIGMAAPLLVAGDAAVVAAMAIAGRGEIAVAPNSAPDARGVLAAARARLTRGDEDGTVRPLYLRPPDVTLAAPSGRRRSPTPVSRVVPLAAYAAGPLALLHRACFPDDPWDAAAMARILTLSGCFGHLAWEREDPVGFVLARDLGDECEILSIGVVPTARRHGIGARLMRAMLAEARQRGSASAVLEVAADNSDARRLYKRLGFSQVGGRPRYYRRAEGLADALIMRLRLAGAATSA